MHTRLSNPWNPHRGACPILGQSAARGFTLVELLVVVAILAVLAGLIAPSLAGARRAAATSACASNLRQLALANHAYAAGHGTFVAAASDIWSSNLQRWHGARSKSSQAFDAARGPLADYVDERGWIKQCPAFRNPDPGFEAGCGGYGYNAAGVGSQAYLVGTYRGAASGMAPEQIADPAGTVMFADTAFAETKKGRTRLLEYSFAEPYLLIADNRPSEAYPAMPSLHFRHDGHANVAWADGHVSREPLTHSRSATHQQHQLGWFGPADNSRFDPY
jgi:prepilin-type N-terminal cleavage/methylation domain-containing protein/prepilin-type processing-associated H-X9-DG protein